MAVPNQKSVFSRLFPYMIEVRCLGEYKYEGKSVYCHTENPSNLKKEISKRNQTGNVYFTVNRVKDEFRYRDSFIDSSVADPVFIKAGKGQTTSDQDIDSREWLIIDIDPKRKNDVSGISATDEEKAGALEVMTNVKNQLVNRGFYPPVVCDSGNGYHLYFKIHEENTDSIRDSMRSFLLKLNELFSTEKADVDTTVFNAARIMRLYGTMTKKGKNYPTRPHRQSSFLEVPDDVENKINDFSLVTSYIESYSPTTKTTNNSSESDDSIKTFESKLKFVKDKLTAWDQPYEEEIEDNGTKLFLKKGCPFNPEHSGKDSYIMVFKIGIIFFKCSHNSCQDYRWADFRKLFEPDYMTTEERDEILQNKLENAVRAQGGVEEEGGKEDEKGGEKKFNPIDIIRIMDTFKNKKGEITGVKSTLANYRIIMTKDPKFAGKFRFNTLNDREEFEGKPLTDSIITSMSIYISVNYLGISATHMVDSVATALCQENKVDPFINEFLNDLPKWDGKSRIDRVLIDVCGAEDTPYSMAVSRLLFMGIVHRAYSPGCDFPYMPILWGGQGAGKSTFCKRIAIKQDWFRENIIPVEDKKRFVEQFSGGVVGEWSELVGMTKAETESVKAHISATDDSHRKSYDRRNSTIPRRCVFIATSNVKDVLKDTTGNRRFLPIEFTTNGPLLEVMLRGKKEWREYITQCYSEAVSYFFVGEECSLPEEMRAIAREKAEESMIEDRNQYVFDEWLSRYIEAQNEFEPEGQRWKVYLHEFMQQCKDNIHLSANAYPARALKPLFNNCPYLKNQKRELIDYVKVWSWEIDRSTF